jgi:hypothetical protein
MSGLILPDGFETEASLNPVGREACVYTRMATSTLADAIDEEGGPSNVLDTYEGSLTATHNDLVVKCEQLCAKGCRVWIKLSTERSGLEVPFTEQEEVFTNTLTRLATLTGEGDEVEQLDSLAKHVKDVVEKRKEIFSQGQDKTEASLMPAITDGAYEALTQLTNYNFNSIFTVLRILSATGTAMQRDGIDKTSPTHPVLLEDPTTIKRSDVMLLLAQPQLQDLLRLQATPRSQIFNPKGA